MWLWLRVQGPAKALPSALSFDQETQVGLLHNERPGGGQHGYHYVLLAAYWAHILALLRDPGQLTHPLRVLVFTSLEWKMVGIVFGL